MGGVDVFKQTNGAYIQFKKVKIKAGTNITIQDSSTNIHPSITINASGSTSSGGIDTLNGLIDSVQTFEIDTTGLDFAIVSVGGIHSFNLPFADSSHVGKLDSTDWLTFWNKLSASDTAYLSYRIDQKLNAADTASLSTRINLKLNIADSTAWGYYPYSNPNGYISSEVDGNITNELQTLGSTSDATSHTVTLSNSGGSVQLVEGSNVTITTSGTGLNGIATIAATSLDTTSISNRINQKLNAVDTASLSNRIDLKMSYTDTASLSNRIDLKMNYTDTVSLSNRINLKLNATDTISLSNRINLKVNTADSSIAGGYYPYSTNPKNYLITEVDGSVSNELQTISNTSDATSHTATLSNSGGSIKLIEGSNITLTTAGTGLDGEVTISSSGGSGITRAVTTITGGTGGSILYDSLGIVGELAVIPESKGGTNQSTYAQGDLLYASAANTLSKLGKNTNATRYLSNTGASNSPEWNQVNLSNGTTDLLSILKIRATGSPSSTTFLRGDSTWSTPSGAALSDGDYVDVDVTGSGTVITVDTNAITEIKINNAAVTYRKTYSSTITPAQITSDQDNYNPTGWQTATTVRISGNNGFRAITSFRSIGILDGEEKKLINVGSYPLYVPSEHPDGIDSNRVNGGQDYIIQPLQSVTITYDSVSNRWRFLDYNFSDESQADALDPILTSMTTGDYSSVGFAFSGTGAGGTATAPSSTFPYGYLACATGTTATGRMAVIQNKTFGATYYGSAHITHKALISFPTLSTGADSFTIFTCITTGTLFGSNNTIGIKYSHGLSGGQWTGYSIDNAGGISVAYLQTANINQTYMLSFEVDKSSTEVRFYVDGVYKGRVTGNLPSAGVASIYSGINKGVGTTNRTMNLARQYLRIISTIP